MAQDMENTNEITGGEIDLGTVKIADVVVGMIAAYAAMEVEGVHGMAGASSSSLFGKSGYKKSVKGVKVELSDSSVKVDLAVTMDYGYNIPTTSSKVQTRVKAAIENMTGLGVSDINVRIAGINIPDDSEET